MSQISDEQILSIWRKRKPSTFGGTINDFIAHAESEINPIILRTKKMGNEKLEKEATFLLHSIQTLARKK